MEKTAQRTLRQLKLYFMVGLPDETEDDIEEIVQLSLKCQQIARTAGMRLSLNIAPFIPKAGTSLQRCGMAGVPVLEKRLAHLRDGLGGTGIDIRAESPQWSHVQGALSRGDETIAAVLANIEKPSLAGWRRAVRKTGVDIEHYVSENWSEDLPLPWEMIG